MLLLLLGISIALVVGGILVFALLDWEGIGGAIACMGIVLAVIILIAMACIIGPCITSETVDEQIAMYQEENIKIEQQIADVVTQYQEYEKDIFTEVSPESAMTLVALYPELKSDTLVASQIDVYVKNNEKIKELKVQQINGHLYRWWMYFGE